MSISGDLDLLNARSAEVDIAQRMQASGRQGIVLDLTEVKFIDSAGLAMLIRMHQDPSTYGELCVEVAEKSQPARVMELARFADVFGVVVKPMGDG